MLVRSGEPDKDLFYTTLLYWSYITDDITIAQNNVNWPNCAVMQLKHRRTVQVIAWCGTPVTCKNKTVS